VVYDIAKYHITAKTGIIDPRQYVGVASPGKVGLDLLLREAEGMGELNPMGTRSKRETKKVYRERDVIETDGRDTYIKEIGQKEGEAIRNEKGFGAIWGNQGDKGIPGKISKRLTAAETRQPTCEELSVAGVGFCFCLACCPVRRVCEMDVGVALGFILDIKSCGCFWTRVYIARTGKGR